MGHHDRQPVLPRHRGRFVVMRILLMMLCLAGGAFNVYAIVEWNGGLLNYIAVAVAFGSALYQMASLVRYP